MNRLEPGLLAGGGRDLPSRHQTLASTIAWSYDLLDDNARCLFDRLSVFMGGGALEQIEIVCEPGLPGDLLDGLTAWSTRAWSAGATTRMSLAFGCWR